MAGHAAAESNDGARRRPEGDAVRHELIFTIVLALAAVATAWCSFQSTKWSGEQADSYSVASAQRLESTRASNEAVGQVTIDVVSFTEWITALQAEVLADPSSRPAGTYEPREGTVSAFVHARFRDEFRPAFDAWVAERPFVDASAPRTPFVMPEYRLEARDRADRLHTEAEATAAEARRANQIGDNYVLLAVMFALVLFFVALGGRARARRTRRLFLVVSIVTFVATLGVLVTFPVSI